LTTRNDEFFSTCQYFTCTVTTRRSTNPFQVDSWWLRYKVNVVVCNVTVGVTHVQRNAMQAYYVQDSKRENHDLKSRFDVREFENGES
jgi:hypothetical protein